MSLGPAPSAIQAAWASYDPRCNIDEMHFKRLFLDFNLCELAISDMYQFKAEDFTAETTLPLRTNVERIYKNVHKRNGMSRLSPAKHQALVKGVDVMERATRDMRHAYFATVVHDTGLAIKYLKHIIPQVDDGMPPNGDLLVDGVPRDDLNPSETGPIYRKPDITQLSGLEDSGSYTSCPTTLGSPGATRSHDRRMSSGQFSATSSSPESPGRSRITSTRRSSQQWGPHLSPVMQQDTTLPGSSRITSTRRSSQQWGPHLSPVMQQDTTLVPTRLNPNLPDTTLLSHNTNDDDDVFSGQNAITDEDEFRRRMGPNTVVDDDLFSTMTHNAITDEDEFRRRMRPNTVVDEQMSGAMSGLSVNGGATHPKYVTATVQPGSPTQFGRRRSDAFRGPDMAVYHGERKSTPYFRTLAKSPAPQEPEDDPEYTLDQYRDQVFRLLAEISQESTIPVDGDNIPLFDVWAVRNRFENISRNVIMLELIMDETCTTWNCPFGKLLKAMRQSLQELYFYLGEHSDMEREDLVQPLGEIPQDIRNLVSKMVAKLPEPEESIQQRSIPALSTRME